MLAEKSLKQKILENPENAHYWFTLCLFYLKRQKFDLAESCLRRVFEIQPEIDIKLNKILYLMYFRRKRYKSALKLLESNLEENKWDIIDNLFMSYL